MNDSQVRLWNCMREAISLAHELELPALFMAAQGLERAYRDLYGDKVPA